jgi:2-hydroxychromene-2-carboxylate isomerase
VITLSFYFDPVCPWTWETSKWIREVEKVRDVAVEWRLLSLQFINEGREDPFAELHARGTPALRAMVSARREGGNDAIGRLYEILARRVHEPPGEELDEDLIRSSLADAGLDPLILDRALDDDSTMEELRAEHTAAVSQVGAFGVPTIVLSNGRGMFGPVIAEAPRGEAAGELWDHVEWMIRQDGFFELKRERDPTPRG